MLRTQIPRNEWEEEQVNEYAGGIGEDEEGDYDDNVPEYNEEHEDMGYYDPESEHDEYAGYQDENDDYSEYHSQYDPNYGREEDDDEGIIPNETPRIISLATGLSDEESEEETENEKEQFFRSDEEEFDWKNIDVALRTPSDQLRQYVTDHFPGAVFPESDDDISIENFLNNPMRNINFDDLVNNGSDGSQNDDEDDDDDYNGNEINYDDEDVDDDDDDDEVEIEYQFQGQQQQQRQLQQQKKKNSSNLKPSSKVTKKAPPRGSDSKKRSNQKQSKSTSLKEVEKKHKMWLLELVERRREEEQQILKKLEKTEMKRKKYTEALVEKARQKQLLQLQQPPPVQQQPPPEANNLKKKTSSTSHTATAAVKSKVSTLPPPAREEITERGDEGNVMEGAGVGLEEEDGDDDEAKRLIDEAVRMRKKFKKQQKEILESLKLKKEEEERKMKEAAEKEEFKKEKLRRRNEKLLRKKDRNQNNEIDPTTGTSLPAGSGVAAVRASRSQGEVGLLSLEETEMDSERNENKSQMKITKRSRSVHSSELVERSAATNRGINKPLQDLENEEEDPTIREVKKANMKRQQEKIQNYLATLAEKKKDEAEKMKKKEERSRKRAILLSQRVQAENNERRLMAREDKYANPGNLDGFVTKPEHHHHQQQQHQHGSGHSHGHGHSHGQGQGQGQDNDPIVKKKISTEMAEAIAARLAARQAKHNETNQPQARDFNDWKKKNLVPSDSRVFCMTGWYPCVKTALLQRGWYFNPDSTSSYFDLKWTLRSSDISENLQSWQLTNHFQKNIALTTKVGLIKSLQQLVWMDNTCSLEIIPRGYDLSNPQEIQEYLDDFRIQEAECILKRLYFQLTGVERVDAMKRSVIPSLVQTGCEKRGKDVEKRDGEEGEKKTCDEIISEECSNEYIGPVPPPIVDLNQIMINEAVFSACCSVLIRFQRPYYQDDHLDKELQPDDHYAISPLEWELIESYDLFKAHTLPEMGPEPIDEFLQERKDAMELNTANMTSKQRQAQQLLNRQKREQKKHDQHLRLKLSNEIKRLRCVQQTDLELIHQLLCRSALINSTQHSLNGRGSTAKNMWIVKPAAKSRGRGITTFNNLNKLLNYVELGRIGSSGRGSISTSSHWIVQKYMENSLIIANRKFDLRQWVLVVDWNPLVIYFYEECYCRFSVDEYTNSEEGMDNSFVHLVNNSIGKNSENFDRVVIAENNEKIEGYMWSYENFCKYIRYRHGSGAGAGAGEGTPGAQTGEGAAAGGTTDDVISKIRKRMKDIAIWALMSGSDHIEHRKNSWELYGFDYMIDDDYVPWLIEINSSPACDYSTKVTERYVQKALVELLNVVLDVREWELTNKKNRENQPCPDTGGWEKIYQGPFLETPSSSFGAEISIKGEVLKLPKRRVEESGGPGSPPTVSSYLHNGPIVKSYQQKRNEMPVLQPPPPPLPASQVRNGNQDEKKSKLPSREIIKRGHDQTRDRDRDRDEEDDDDCQQEGEGAGEGGGGDGQKTVIPFHSNSLNDSDSDYEGEGEGEGEEGEKRQMKQNRTGGITTTTTTTTAAGGGAEINKRKTGSTHHPNRLRKGDSNTATPAVTSIPIKTFSMEL